ncbi:KR domain-containing protein [Nocardia sp. CDC159]|uniref:KR domain-containing protein n=1 Tax=Nocardia pulmonis TaxID=2951408 RepID=A0A9X2IZ00_9NOCA|nr:MULTISPECIES: type I polyketide synthase [Nocardia]MCM6777562.1 KR domain-containing protein [Nocardia pulmonis]MCM6790331.1 KR domain-containing protein [Nocardia sp. CDC159]
MTDPEPRHRPVSIIGIGCRMPGAVGVRRFWGLLTGDPAEHAEFVFDHDWFGINTDAAAALDPRERSSLTVAVEAIDDAGIGYRARGSPAAVLFGASGSNMIANRVSQALDLRGPSLVLDSAGSSSLAAVDLAVRLLADGTVPWALVGGVDAADVCTVLVLQRTVDARREGNRVYAELLGTAVGSDGRVGPDGATRRRIIRTAWERAGIDPHAAGYFECHGDATSAADAVEIEALAQVLHAGSEPAAKIWIGSVTADLGPLEAAAGVTGLAKAALCIDRGIIVPASVFRQRSAALRLDERGLRVPTEPIGWQEVAARGRVAGVGSVGRGGTAAHAVLRGVAQSTPERAVDPPILIPIGGADPARLRSTAGRWADALLASHPPLPEFASASARLLPEPVRAVVFADKHAEAVARLRALARGHADGNAAVLGPTARRHDGGVLLLFPGGGGGQARMGWVLAARYPTFARAIAEVTEAVVRAGGRRVWTPRHGFVPGAAAMFVFQIALAELVRAWGIRFDAVIGYGRGEFAAAAVSGALALDDAARLMVAWTPSRSAPPRAVLLETTPEEAGRLVEPLRGEVAVAAVHGPDAVVVAGAARRLDAVVRRARRRGMAVRAVPADLGLGDPADPPVFAKPLAGLRPGAPDVPLYSTTRRGAVITDAVLDADYWAENLCGTVHFAAALESAAADGITTVLEIAPQPILAPVVRDYPDFRESTHPMAGTNEAVAFLGGIARLYLEGRDVDWSAHGAFTGTVLERCWRADVSDGHLPAGDRTDRVRVTRERPAAQPPIESHRVATGYDATVATALEWAASVLRTENWVRIAPPVDPPPRPNRALVLGESPLAVALARTLDRSVPTRRVPGAITTALAELREPTAVIVVWSPRNREDAPAAAAARALELLRELRGCPAVAALTVVLRDRTQIAQRGVAGVIRALRSDTTPPTRLIWCAAEDAPAVAAAALNYDATDELSIDGPSVTARRFRPASPTPAQRAIAPEGTYVVTGGLGVLGAVAVRWLLLGGARDVVILTRTPRPLPPLLEGLDDRIVVARCDVTDRADLASALDDIRACGSAIRGLVHAAGVGARGETGSAPGESLDRSFAPTVLAALDLLELTAADSIDFALLFAIAAEGLSGPGAVVRAAIGSALDAVAATRLGAHTTSIAWGSWGSDHPARPLRRAGITPLDPARATAILTRILDYREPTLLALDYTPAADHHAPNRHLHTLFTNPITPQPLS